MIIQSIALLDQLDKDLNTFAMRVKEWYSWHFPELKDIVKDNYIFARCAAYIQVSHDLHLILYLGVVYLVYFSGDFDLCEYINISIKLYLPFSQDRITENRL